MGLEPCEAHWGGQNTTAPRREAQGQDRSAAREDQACAPDYPVILPGPRCRLYYRLLSKPDERACSQVPRTGAARTPLRRGEKLSDKIEAQLARIKHAPQIIRSFFQAPDVAYITGC